MARLTAKRRNALPKSDFALPRSAAAGASKSAAGSYPIDTPARARNALARGAQNLAPQALATVRRKVEQKFPSIEVSTPKGAKNPKPRARKARGTDISSHESIMDMGHPAKGWK